MIKLRLILLFTIIVLTSGCTEFAILMSGSSLAVSQNAYVKAYNAVDFGVVVTTKKGIKQHAYEKGKKHIVDHVKSKTLGVINNH